MDNIQVFNNPDFGDIRTILIDGEPWFVGRDIALKLGYAKPQNALKDNIEEGDARKRGIPDANNHIQQMIIINEAGLYSLIFGSKLETAKKFKKWVTSEVLPSIRKTGAYGQPKSTMELLELHYQALKDVNARVNNVSDEVQTVKAEVIALKDELPLFPSEADKIKDAVNKKVVSLLGGKEANAYKDRSLCYKVFSNCYHNLKGNFKVGKYTEIKRKYRHEALKIVDRYEPPFFLAEQIANTNAQQTLNLEGGAAQ